MMATYVFEKHRPCSGAVVFTGDIRPVLGADPVLAVQALAKELIAEGKADTQIDGSNAGVPVCIYEHRDRHTAPFWVLSDRVLSPPFGERHE